MKYERTIWYLIHSIVQESQPEKVMLELWHYSKKISS